MLRSSKIEQNVQEESKFYRSKVFLIFCVFIAQSPEKSFLAIF